MNRVLTLIGSTQNDLMTDQQEATIHTSEIHQSIVAYSHLNEELQGNPAYVYYFKRKLPGDASGAFHSSELWYMFGTLDACWRPMTDGDDRLSEQMLDEWTHFIQTGNPNGAQPGQWEPCIRGNPYVREYDVSE